MGVKDGSKEEVLSYFAGIHARPRQMLDKPTSWRRWSTADREPVEKWGPTALRWWVMLRIRWHNIWRRVPVWRLKMLSLSVRRYSSVTAMRLMPLLCMSRCVFRVLRASSGRRAKWDVCTTPQASSASA